MLKKSIFRSVFVCSMAAGCSGENSSDPTAQVAEALTPSLNTWVDACNATDPAYYPLLQAEVFLVPATLVTKNADGTYAISSRAYTALGGTVPLDPSSKFYNQQQALAGRSGFLVDRQHVITAPHGDSTVFKPSSFAAIFGLASRKGGPVCIQPDFSKIPAANVFWPQDTGAVYGYETDPKIALKHDYIFFKLDRDTGRQGVRIRRTGEAEVGDRIALLSHPERLSTKVDLAGTYGGAAVSYDVSGYYSSVWIQGFHASEGSSGGMFYNLDKGYVEAVVANSFGCLNYAALPAPSTSYIGTSRCLPYPLGSNLPIKEFAPKVPTNELRVSPLNTVVHTADIGGSLSSPQTVYTMYLPTSAPSSLSWYITPVTPSPTDAVAQLSFSPTTLSGSLSPGDTKQITVTASTTATSCGRYTRQFIVSSPGFQDTLTHRFEIGLKEFAVTPSTNFEASVINKPYAASTNYVVTNPRPSPVTVVVSTDTWLSVSTQQDDKVTLPKVGGTSILLGAAGSSTESATFVVSTNADAARLTPYVPTTATLAFGYSGADVACAVTPAQTRTFTLTPAMQTYVSANGLEIPQSKTPGTFGTPVTDTLTILDSFKIASTTLQLGFLEAETYGYLHLRDYAPNLKAILTSPDGKQYTLWNSNALPSSAYVFYEAFIGGTIQVLSIDDVKTPSPTGQKLSDLAGKDAKGTWTLQLSTSNTTGLGLLLDWRLVMKANIGVTPIVALSPIACSPSAGTLEAMLLDSPSTDCSHKQVITPHELLLKANEERTILDLSAPLQLQP